MRPDLPVTLCWLFHRPCATCRDFFRRRRRERFLYLLDTILEGVESGDISSLWVATHIEVASDIADGWGHVSDYTGD